MRKQLIRHTLLIFFLLYIFIGLLLGATFKFSMYEQQKDSIEMAVEEVKFIDDRSII